MGVFNKTIIPLTLVGYEMIIASHISYPLISHVPLGISYPTRTHGILLLNNNNDNDNVNDNDDDDSNDNNSCLLHLCAENGYISQAMGNLF